MILIMISNIRMGRRKKGERKKGLVNLGHCKTQKMWFCTVYNVYARGMTSVWHHPPGVNERSHDNTHVFDLPVKFSPRVTTFTTLANIRMASAAAPNALTSFIDLTLFLIISLPIRKKGIILLGIQNSLYSDFCFQTW